MNIKSVTGPLLPADIKKIERRAVPVPIAKPANQSEDQKDQKPKMTIQQLEQAAEHLRSLSGIKDNGLLVRIETNDGVSVIFVEDATGKVVRRFPEVELLVFTSAKGPQDRSLI